MARVVLNHLHKVFRGASGESINAVNDVCLAIEDGEFFVLVGPSGCGKTTTLRLIAGLETTTRGTIALDGRTIDMLHPRDRDVAMVFQNHALYPHKTVYENLALPLQLRGARCEETHSRVGEVAHLLDLESCLDRLPRALSGGQRQRVALGRALVRRPKVFLFDEPLANLDAPLRAQMRLELQRLQQQFPATIIYVTHDQAEAMTMGRRMAVMQAGQIQQVGEPLTIYRRPANLFVAGFLGTAPMNLFTGTLESSNGRVLFREVQRGAGPAPAGFRLAIPAQQAGWVARHHGQPIVLGIRPEHVLLHSTVTPSEASCVETIVERIESTGADTFVHLQLGCQTCVARSHLRPSVNVGTRLTVALDLTQASFFDAVTGRALAPNDG